MASSPHLDINKTVHGIVESLQRISTLCNPKIGEPSVNPGGLDVDVEALCAAKSNFLENYNMRNGSETSFLQTNFVSKILNKVQGFSFCTICVKLSNCVDKGECDEIRKYGELANELVQQILYEYALFEQLVEKEKLLKAEIKTSRETFKKFESVSSPIFSIERILKKIRAHCLPMDGCAPRIGVRELDSEFSAIEAHIQCYEGCLYDFNDFLRNTSHLDPRLFESCSTLLLELNNIVNNDALTSVCALLPIAIEQSNEERITFSGRQVAELCATIAVGRRNIENNLVQLQFDYIHQPTYDASRN